MTLQFHYTVVGVEDADGQPRWYVDYEATGYTTPVWDETAGEWRHPATDTESTADARLVRDLERRLGDQARTGRIDDPYFTQADLRRLAGDADVKVTGRVAVRFNYVLQGDHETFLDLLSESLIGSQLLEDIGYRVVGHEPGDVVVFEVTGRVGTHLDWLDQGPGGNHA